MQVADCNYVVALWRNDRGDQYLCKRKRNSKNDWYDLAENTFKLAAHTCMKLDIETIIECVTQRPN